MITINTAKGVAPLSILKGIPGNRDWPPVAEKTELGNIVAENLSSLKTEFPFLKILRRVIMPEHLHFVIFIQEASNIHLGDIITYFKRNCCLQYMTLIANRTNSPLPENITMFEYGYHDRILLKKNQLNKMLNYISDNPRRRLLRMSNPGFHRRNIIQLGNNRSLNVYGNVDLLYDSDIEAVKISRKYSPEVLRKRKICWKHTVENCGVLVSPFISENEKRVLNWAMENGGRIIYIINEGIGERFTPKGRLHQLCDEGRLLIIGANPPAFAKLSLTRAHCEDMNNIALEISEGNFKIIR